MIELKNIKKTYKNGKKNSVEALKGISTVFPDVGMVFIVGKSGGGKSTLLNILGGLDSYDDGDFLIDGVSTKDFTNSNWDSFRNHYVGFVFQDHHLMPEYNVRENIGFALALQSDENDHNSKIDAALETVDLKGFGERHIRKLSGGQRQRVAIARALVKEYHMILADEPTGNLDVATAREIFCLLKEISKNKLVIIVTHDVEAANAYADMAFRIRDGIIVDSAVTPEFEKYVSTAERIEQTQNNSTESLNAPQDNLIMTAAMQENIAPASTLPLNNVAAEATTSTVQSTALTGTSSHSSAVAFATTQSTLPTARNINSLVFNKTKLSKKAVWQMIGRIFRLHTVKLVLNILVSVLALLMLCSSFKYLVTWNPYGAQARSMKHESASIISVNDFSTNKDGAVVKRQGNFTQNDINTLKTKYLNDSIYHIYKNNHSIRNFAVELKEYQKNYYETRISGFCELGEADIKSLGYTLLDGEYPNEFWQDNDILLTQYHFELFQLCGLLDEQGQSTEIQNYSDIIGKSIQLAQNYHYYVVRGIVDTHIPKNLIKAKDYANIKLAEDNKSGVPSIKPPNTYYLSYSNSYMSRNANVHKMFFQKIGANAETDIDYVLQKNDKSTNAKKARYIMDSDRFQFEGEYSETIRGFIYMSTQDRDILMKFVLPVAAVGLAISLFLICNFIGSSISNTIKEIGVLRCVGASKKDIFLIYFLIAIVFASVLFIITLLLLTFLCMPYLSFMDFASKYFPFHIYVLSFFDVLFLIGILGAISSLACVLPLIKVFKKTPMQILTEM